MYGLICLTVSTYVDTYHLGTYFHPRSLLDPLILPDRPPNELEPAPSPSSTSPNQSPCFSKLQRSALSARHSFPIPLLGPIWPSGLCLRLSGHREIQMRRLPTRRKNRSPVTEWSLPSPRFTVENSWGSCTSLLQLTADGFAHCLVLPRYLPDTIPDTISRPPLQLQTMSKRVSSIWSTLDCL